MQALNENKKSPESSDVLLEIIVDRGEVKFQLIVERC